MANQKKCNEGDFLELGPSVGNDGNWKLHLYRRHRADHVVEAGIGGIRPVDGPLQPGEIMCRKRSDGRYTVDEDSSRSGSGPAKITSDAYRTGWDSIFGNRQVMGEA